MAELFDRYVVVDWSASSRPTTGRDSIWIAVLDERGVVDLANPATRHRAEAVLCDLFDHGGQARTLVAIDAPMGYPAGTARRFGLADGATESWRATWRSIVDGLVDDERNANNRFEVAAGLNRRTSGEGPFWGRPMALDVNGLEPTKPRPFPDPEFRHCEGWLRAGGLRPASCWQLSGIGSVGSQTLTLVPIVVRLVERFGCEVWPFSTGWNEPDLPPGGSVLAETWPTAFEVRERVHWIRDAAQVHDVARHLRRADRSGALAEWFLPPLGLATDAAAAVESEEGWALVPPFRGSEHES